MEGFGLRVLVAPDLAVSAFAFVLAGSVFGAVSGLTPGLHVNNVTLLVASVAPALPWPPLLVGVAILAAGVVHTFLNIVPALAIGVPDPSMAVTALPGHRLVMDGRGREAIRLSAVGSALAVVFAVPLAIPVTQLMVNAYPVLNDYLPVVLTAVAVFLVATEPTVSGQIGGAAAFLTSSVLGYTTLDATLHAPLGSGDVLMPLFSGLFGAPVLVDALRGTGVPVQADAAVLTPQWYVTITALAGAVAGAVVAYLPGVSSAIAAVLALTVIPGRTDSRAFIVATSGVNTSNAIFALFALASLGSPRTGVMVALDEASAPLNVPLFVASALAAAAIGFTLVLAVGDWYLRIVGRLDYTKLSLTVLSLLVALSYLFAGRDGVVVFAVSAVVGLLPTRLGARRIHLMGVLLGPLIVGR